MKYIILLSLILITACSDPEISDDILDGEIIFDASLSDPQDYLLSYKIPQPTQEDLSKAVIITAHGYTATNFEWDEFRSYLSDKNDVLISQVLLGAHGRSFKDFKASTWEDWQSSIIEEYERLYNLGYRNISIAASSTGCALVTELFASNYFNSILTPKNIFFIDPFLISSDKNLYLIDIAGPLLGYVESDLEGDEVKYWYKFRPYESLKTLRDIGKIVRHELEDGISINGVSNFKIWKSIKDDVADPVGAVLYWKGITFSSNKIDVEMVDSEHHVFTRLELAKNVSEKDIQNQINCFDEMYNMMKGD